MGVANVVGGVPRGASLYEILSKSLPADLAAKFDNIFERRVITDASGTSYKVGGVVREAWQSETALTQEQADEITKLVLDVLEGNTLTSYFAPTCCYYHSTFRDEYFAKPAYYPSEHEFLEFLSKLIWTAFPHLRGLLKMNSSATRKDVSMSRFMRLDYFLKRHHLGVIGGSLKLDDAITEFQKSFIALLPKTLRQVALRDLLDRNVLKGSLGSFPEPDPYNSWEPHYCDQGRPFSTPAQGIRQKLRETEAPDRELKRLGLQFDQGQTFVELMYNVSVQPDHTISPTSPSAPTVIDSEGYWLFQPDRSNGSSSDLRWNFTRDLATNKKGRRELIGPFLPISKLTDVIVWPLPTKASWSHDAADSLSVDLVV